MSKPLCCYASNSHRGRGFLVPAVHAADKRRQELSIKSRIIGTKGIVSYGRSMIAEKLLLKAIGQKSIANVLFVDRYLRRQRHVGIKSSRGLYSSA
jgi:hypothetical protein